MARVVDKSSPNTKAKLSTTAIAGLQKQNTINKKSYVEETKTVTVKKEIDKKLEIMMHSVNNIENKLN